MIKLVGTNANVAFDGQAIAIVRGQGGLAQKLSGGSGKSEVIYSVDRIQAVNFREASRLKDGFILFNVSGVDSPTPPSINGSVSEGLEFGRAPNVVLFKRKGNSEFAQLREAVESAISIKRAPADPPPPAAATASIGEELQRLQGLLEQGLLSREEFDDLKAKLLQ